MNEEVYFGKDKHTIEVKPITLVFNSSFEDSIYVDRVIITPDMTLEYYNHIKEIDPYTIKFFKIAIPDFPHEITKLEVDKYSMCFKHLIGLFSLSLHFIMNNVKFGWKYPESYLHPKYQGNLADVMLIFSDKEKFTRLILETKEEILERNN